MAAHEARTDRRMAGAILGFAAAVAVVVIALIGRGPDREPTTTIGGSATTIAPTVLGTVIERGDTTVPAVAPATTPAPAPEAADPVATDTPSGTDELPPPTLIPPLVVENPNAP